MAHSAGQYGQYLKALFPPGRAFPRGIDTNLHNFLLAWGDALARLDARVDTLMLEADPRTTTELLPEWETEVGLPDPCSGVPSLLAQARAEIAARLTGLGGQSRAYFIELAAALGYTITIEEPSPWTCDSDCDAPILNDDWAFTWIVHGGATPVWVFTCDDNCDAPLQSFGNTTLECVIRRYAPPDTTVLFAYGG